MNATGKQKNVYCEDNASSVRPPGHPEDLFVSPVYDSITAA